MKKKITTKSRYDEISEIIIIIGEFNFKIFSKDEDGYEKAFSYSTDGTIDTISLYGKEFWNSEFDDREWIEEINDYEPLEPFLLKKLKSYIDTISKYTSYLEGDEK